MSIEKSPIIVPESSGSGPRTKEQQKRMEKLREPTESMDKDSRLKLIEDELVEEWKQTIGKLYGVDIYSEEGQNFLYGDPLALRRGEKPISLKQRAEKVFLERFPEKAQMHAEEKTAKLEGGKKKSKGSKKTGSQEKTGENNEDSLPEEMDINVAVAIKRGLFAASKEEKERVTAALDHAVAKGDALSDRITSFEFELMTEEEKAEHFRKQAERFPDGLVVEDPEESIKKKDTREKVIVDREELEVFEIEESKKFKKRVSIFDLARGDASRYDTKGEPVDISGELVRKATEYHLGLLEDLEKLTDSEITKEQFPVLVGTLNEKYGLSGERHGLYNTVKFGLPGGGILRVKVFLDMDYGLSFATDWGSYEGAGDDEDIKTNKVSLATESATEGEVNKEELEVFEIEESDEKKAERLRGEIEEAGTFKEFGVSLDDLKNIEGFETLSHGQRLLVAENLKQITLGRVHEEAGEKYKEDTANARFLGRIWQNISKKYQIAKLEKSTAKDIVLSGMEANGKVLMHLIERASDGPDVEVSKDGTLEMLYVSGKEDLNMEKKEIVENFNKIASKFSRMPEEWRFETSSKKEQKEYQELREQYEKAKVGVLGIKSSQLGNQDAALYMNDIDSRVYGDQNLNTHPDVEKQLQSITDKNVWMHVMANVATERGIYSAAGFLTRSVTTGLFGVVGLPISAGLVGGFMARKRAREALREHEAEARRGVEDKSKEAKNFVGAEQLRGKLEKLAQKISTEKDPEKKEKLLMSLNARISYTQGKIEDGLVNYGKGENRFASQYELTSSLGSAVAGREVGGMEESKLEKRLESFLNFKEEKISDTQKKYIRNQMMKGAAIGAGFAVAGYALRHFGEEWFGWSKKAGVEMVKAKQVPSALEDIPTVDNIPAQDEIIRAQSRVDFLKQMQDNNLAEARSGVMQGGGVSGTEDVAQELIKEIPKIGYTVKSGDNVWNIIENKMEAQGLFEGMKEGQKTHLVDTFKDKFTAMSPEKLKEIGIGSGDPNVLKVGENIDLTSVLRDTEALPEAMYASEMLSDVQIEAIEANNIKIADWAVAHPNESITSDKIDDILSGKGVETFTPEVLSMADNVMQNKIKNIYEHGFLFFKGSQIEEWTGNPADGIMGVKDMKVENILKGNFGEPFGGGLDAAQENNREQLLGFLNELKSEVKPVGGETTGEYVKRALAIQISTP